MSSQNHNASSPGLRRELRFSGAIALSIAIMTPTAAMSTGAIEPSVLVGHAAALVYVLAAVAIGFVAYGFVRLTQHFSHAGSVYAFTGATLGPQAGFVTGWALFGTYLMYTALTATGCGIFAAAFLEGVGIWPHANWFPLALVFGLAALGLAYADVRVIMRSLLTFEGISVALVVILVVTILLRLISGHTPDHQSLNMQPFLLPPKTSLGNLGLATVFGFLSFAGFEGAAALGEETRSPRRNIPRAIAFSVAFAALFYLVCIYAQVVGFGTGHAGVAALTSSSSPLGQLARSYIGKPMADALNLGITISSFAGAIGAATAGSRLLYAFGRDGLITYRLGRTSARTGTPAAALVCVGVVAVGTVVALGATGAGMFDVYFWTATIGTLSLLVAYIVTSFGALRFLFWTTRTTATWEVIFPIGAVGMLGFVLWSNLYPVPAFPYNLFPYVVAGWLLVSLGAILFAPGLAERIGRSLAESEGMTLSQSTASAASTQSAP